MNATEAASVDAEASAAIGGEGGAATANGPTNFAAALSTWRAINLGELQKTLDAQGKSYDCLYLASYQDYAIPTAPVYGVLETMRDSRVA